MEDKKYFQGKKNVSIEQIEIWVIHIAINFKKDLNKATISIKQELISNIQELGEDTARQQEMKDDLQSPGNIHFTGSNQVLLKTWKETRMSEIEKEFSAMKQKKKNQKKIIARQIKKGLIICNNLNNLQYPEEEAKNNKIGKKLKIHFKVTFQKYKS